MRQNTTPAQLLPWTPILIVALQEYYATGLRQSRHFFSGFNYLYSYQSDVDKSLQKV